MNLHLSTARIYSKLWTGSDIGQQIKNLEQSLRDYEWISSFMREYLKASKQGELPPGMAEPLKMMNEMVDLLPVKIAKLNAKMMNK